MSTLNRVLKGALQLSSEQQEMPIEIFQNRHRENDRAEIATDAQQRLADLHTGKFRHQSAQDVISALGGVS